MNIDNIQAQFNAVSEQYDRQRQALIPCFHDFYGMAVRLGGRQGMCGTFWIWAQARG